MAISRSSSTFNHSNLVVLENLLSTINQPYQLFWIPGTMVWLKAFLHLDWFLIFEIFPNPSSCFRLFQIISPLSIICRLSSLPTGHKLWASFGIWSTGNEIRGHSTNTQSNSGQWTPTQINISLLSSDWKPSFFSSSPLFSTRNKGEYKIQTISIFLARYEEMKQQINNFSALWKWKITYQSWELA